MISQVFAREILDCRGIPTVEVFMSLNTGAIVSTSAPTGTSTGKHEALEVRDNDPNRYQGLGVTKVVDNINKIIAPKIIGMDPTKQGEIDNLLIQIDGSVNKSRLGANAILAISQAVCKAGAAAFNLPVYKYLALKYRLMKEISIPVPAFNVINGGKHGAGNLDFQEFLIFPSSRYPFHQCLQIGVEVFYSLERALISKNAIHSTGVEGGFAPNLFTNLDALEVLMLGINQTQFQYGHDIFLGLDVAASTFHKNGKYNIKDRSQGFSSKEFIEYYKDLNDQYHIFSLEDPLSEDDWSGWVSITQELSDKIMIVGDDLITSNKTRVIKAIKEKSCNAIVIKPNQIGTISETVEVVKLAKLAGWAVFVSIRSGDTTDDFIADFAVGIGADYAKFGAPNRGERIIKYNRLLHIEHELSFT